MRIFTDRNFIYKLIFLAFIFSLIFFLPITGIPFIISQRPMAIGLVLAIFIFVLNQLLRIGLTKYTITDKGELVIAFRNKEIFRESISKIKYISDIDPAWAWIRGAFVKAKSFKIHMLDGRSISIYQELADKNGSPLPDVLISEFKISSQKD
jgi:hypothetical protein